MIAGSSTTLSSRCSLGIGGGPSTAIPEATSSWGSDAQNRPVNPDDHSVGTLQAAKFESGLDNSPMYDDATYNPETHQMPFADVGLISLYIADCDALAEIADVLENKSAAAEIPRPCSQISQSARDIVGRQVRHLLKQKSADRSFQPPPVAHKLLSTTGESRGFRAGRTE